MDRKEVMIEGEKLYLIKSKYMDGTTAILVEDEYGSPFGKVTVCLSTYTDYLKESGEDFVFVKTYEENYWVELLLEQGLFKDCGWKVQSGFCEYPLWEVLF